MNRCTHSQHYLFLLATTASLLFAVHSGVNAQFNNSQLVTRIWTHTTGDPGDTLNWTNQVIDGNGDLIQIGNTITSTNTTDMLLTKYDPTDGSLIWQVQYDNSGNDDYGISVVVDASNNIYTATTSYVSSTNGYDWVIQKRNSSNTVQWTKTFHSGIYDVPTDMKYDGSGHLYVTGVRTVTTTFQDYCTIKYNTSDGSQPWSSPAYYDYANLIDIPAAITIGGTGRIIVAGGSGSSLTNWDFATVKYSPSTGSQVSATRNASSGLGFDQPTSIAKDQNDNIYVTGYASVTGNSYDIKVVKLDTELNTIWSVTYDGGDHLNDGGNSIGVDANGYVYVTGYTTKTNGGKDIVTLKYNASGTLQWSKKYPAPDPTKTAIAKKLDIDPYGNILIVGDAYNIGNRDLLILAYDPSGNKKWEEWYTGSGNGDDYASGIKIDDASNNFYVTGKIWTGSSYTYQTNKYQMVDFIIPPDGEYSPNNFAFDENDGQLKGTDNSLQPDIKFYSTNINPAVYFFNDKCSFVFSEIDTLHATQDTLHRVDLTFQGSLSTQAFKVGDHVPGYKNYFLPQCSSGVTGERGYKKILYPQIYTDIDLMFSSNTAGIKYYFICDPRSDPSDIIMKFTGASSVSIVSNKLKIVSSIGNLTLERPSVYQIDESGNIVTLGWQSSYVSLGSNKYGLSTGTYDAGKPLIFVIEDGTGGSAPTITADCVTNTDNKLWSTFFGGNNDDYANDVNVDVNGNAYVVGITWSGQPFPTTAGAFQSDLSGEADAFIAKFDNQYSQDQGWATYYGGSDIDDANNVVFTHYTAADRIFVVGHTYSSDITLDNDIGATFNYGYGGGGNADGFILALDGTGASIWFTYIGGDGNDWAYGITSDGSSKLFICGQASSGLQVKSSTINGEFYDDSYNENVDGFVGAFSISGAQLWTTYFGGQGSEALYEIAYDGTYGRIYAVGSEQTQGSSTTSITCDPSIANGALPICKSGTCPFYQSNFGGSDLVDDGLIVGFSTSDYSLKWSTLLGGSDDDRLFGVTTSPSGDVYVVGGTLTSSNGASYSCSTGWDGATNGLPVLGTYATGYIGSSDLYLAKFNHDNELVWGTYYGGLHGQEGGFLSADVAFGNDNVYMTGSSYRGNQADNYPVITNGNAYTQSVSGKGDAVITAFSSIGHPEWSTFFGGSSDKDFGDQNYGIALNPTHDQLYTVGAFDANDPSIKEAPFGNSYIADPNADLPNSYDAFLAAFCISLFYTDVPSVNNIEPVFSLYPNPSYDNVHLSWDKNLFQTSSIVQLINELGQCVKSISVEAHVDEVDIDVSQLNSGIFFVRILNRENMISQKFVHVK